MSNTMDQTLRAGILALLRTGHAAPEIGDLLECSQKTVAHVQRFALSKNDDGPGERWAAGRRGHYDQDLNEDIRRMLAEDRPTSVIAKECHVAEEVVRQIRQHDCPITDGTRRIEERLMEQRPFRIGRAGAALRFEAIAACFGDCLAEGDGAMRRLVHELEQLVRDQALPEPGHELLASALREHAQRRLTKLELAARLDEIGLRLEGRAEPPAPAKRQRAS